MTRCVVALSLLALVACRHSAGTGADAGEGAEAGAPRCDEDGGACPQNEVCDPTLHACVAACAKSADCESGVCDHASGHCVECLESFDCQDASRSYCDVERHRCGECLPDQGECPAGERCASDETGYRCVLGCNSDGDCLVLRLGHDAGLSEVDGGALDGKAKCDPAAHRCVECLDDADCPDATVCKRGACVTGCSTEKPCQPGQACCEGLCADTAADVGNCGQCGNACQDGASCCGGACVDVSSDAEHCGQCGQVCTPAHALPTCKASVCGVASCASGFADCDGQAANGCETDTAHDLGNCGACGNVCTGGSCGSAITTQWYFAPSGWNFNGDAHFDVDSQSAVLTDAKWYSAGTFIRARPIWADVFTVSFDFKMGGGQAGDGMGFMMQTNGPTAVGKNGSGLGISNLSGWGVELDTHNNHACGDDSDHQIGVDDLSTCGDFFNPNNPTSLAANDSPVGLRNSGWHTAKIDFENGKIFVSIDDRLVINGYALHGYVPGPYYLGFGAGTGGASDRHEVKNVTVSFPAPRCL